MLNMENLSGASNGFRVNFLRDVAHVMVTPTMVSLAGTAHSV